MSEIDWPMCVAITFIALTGAWTLYVWRERND